MVNPAVKKSAWPLRPGDLPEPRVVRAEPRLAGMADNAVFRLAIFCRRARPFHFRFLSRQTQLMLLGWAIAAAIVLVAFSSTRYFPFAFVAFIAAPLIVKFWLRRGSRERLAVDFGIPLQYLRDLCNARVHPEEIAAGLWGAEASRASRRRFLWFDAALIAAVGAISLPAAAALPAWASLVGYGAIALAAADMARRQCAPFPQLRPVFERVGGALGRPAPEKFFAPALGAWLGATVAYGAAQMLIGPAWSASIQWLAGAACAVAVGVAWGLYDARQARLDAGFYFGAIVNDLAVLLSFADETPDTALRQFTHLPRGIHRAYARRGFRWK